MQIILDRHLRLGQTHDMDDLTAADIERLAAERGRTMQQVCADLGIAYTTFWRWKAKRGEPSLTVYRRFRDAVSNPVETDSQSAKDEPRPSGRGN